MNILILGDIMGSSGRKALKSNLIDIIKKNNIDFTVVNGENAADSGKGINKKIVEELLDLGVDVITSGNHIWDQQGTTELVSQEERLLRPLNLAEGSPGNGYGTYSSKNKKFKVTVVNLMGNVFMRKTNDAFIEAKKNNRKNKIKRNF